ncbi:hypothetical protein GC209_05760 [bacterium]|nr:hypothetical protein [bacterium]
MILRIALILATALPAAAECVTYQSFTKGVKVTLEDGTVWTARRDAHDVIRIDQINGKEAYARYVVGPFGVYPTESTRNGKGSISEFSYRRDPVEPRAGMDWTSNVKAQNTLIGAAPDPVRYEKVHVTAGAARVVRLGKCRYAAMGVDMGHLGGPYPTVQHFTYFPDLRFGIQTQITYPAATVKKAAVLAMKAE